ncbi:MAG: D-glucuronyl C5-epimerase family protein [candidate division WOR-3 bacterium]
MYKKLFFISLFSFIFFSCEYSHETPEFNVRKYNLRILPYDSLHLVSRNVIPLSETYPCDAEGVPLFLNPQDGKYYYNPVLVAIKGMQYLNSYYITGDIRYVLKVKTWVRKLLEIAYKIDNSCFFPYQFTIRPHGTNTDTLFAPWFSGMARGQVLELVVRLFNFTQDSSYLIIAEKIFNSIKNASKNNYPWVSFVDADGYLWIEEYPLDGGPDYVLNGFIHAVQGVYEYWLLTRNKEVELYLNGCLTTLEDKLHLFRNPGGPSFYCLRHHHIDPLYHKHHIYLIQYLYKMTGNNFFKNFADTLAADYDEQGSIQDINISSGQTILGIE